MATDVMDDGMAGPPVAEPASPAPQRRLPRLHTRRFLVAYLLLGR